MNLGRGLIAAGLLLIVLGVIVVAGERFSIRFGRLPGDLFYRGRNTSFYFPLMSCVVVSVALSLVMWLIGRFR